MNILIYHPANSPAKDLESLMSEFVQKGHAVFLLTQTKKDSLHENSEKLGVKTFSEYDEGRLDYFKKIVFLINFCKKNTIDIVYSNLQQCSKVSIIAQYFTKTNFIIYRHHSDSVYLYGTQKEKLLDWIINKLAKKIIVISKVSAHQIISIEKTNPKKVVLIPLGYNFNFLPKPNLKNVSQIKQQFNAKLLVTIAGRLIPLKRTDIAINVVADLLVNGLDIKLLILGSGTEEYYLKELIIRRNVQEKVFMLGHKKNIEDYIEASDLLIHVSNSEASCHMPKEAGVLAKPVIVCENVGDFSDYIINEENGILIDKINTYLALLSEIEKLYNNDDMRLRLGVNLKATILNKFSIKKQIAEHERLIHNSNE